MKRLITALLIVVAVVFSSCTLTPQISNDKKSRLNGIWISFTELNFDDKTKSGFKSRFDNMMRDVSQKGFNAVFVHIRPRADAFYKSDIFPFSEFASGEQGKNPGYDPMEIMIDSAHRNNLQFHAWINPFRVAPSTDLNKLSSNNIAKKWLSDDDKSNDEYVLEVNGGLWFNPSVKRVRELVVSGVCEIVENYDVDGVHMDDYFYPSTDKSIDKTQYSEYCKENKNPLKLYDFRRSCINDMVKNIYNAVKKTNESILFGISPQANMDNNYDSLYADVKCWCQNTGYIDYIAPQVYFGFEYKYVTKSGQKMQFESCVDYFINLVTNNDISLYIGLGMYKSGTKASDIFDSENEWINHSDIIARQIECISEKERVSGFIIFSYTSMTQNATAKRETINMIDAIKKVKK